MIELRTFRTRSGPYSAKLTIPKHEAHAVSDPDFWPRFVTCRPWVNVTNWRERTRNDDYDHEEQDTLERDDTYESRRRSKHNYPERHYDDSQSQYKYYTDNKHDDDYDYSTS